MKRGAVVRLRTGAIVVLLIYLIALVPVQAKSIIPEVDEPRVGIVIDVIDGNALRVMYLKTTVSIPETELILLSGVDTFGSDTAFEYTKNQLLGKPVFILYDVTDSDSSDDFSEAYVFLQTNESYNETLLRFGYGALNDQLDSLYYDDLEKAHNVALRQEIGIYETSETPPNIININTASVTMLEEHFDITFLKANAIVNYRKFNPINDSQELGFITSFFDRETIEKVRGGIHYETNVNTATIYELSSLFGSGNSLDLAYALDRERIFTDFSSVNQLEDLDVMDGYYEAVELFLKVEANDNLLEEPFKEVINVNTASKNELVEIGGLTATMATNLVSLRSNSDFSFYSIEELGKVNFPMQNLGLLGYADELSIVTDINSASETEIASLFSRFGLSDYLKGVLAEKLVKYRPFYDYDDLRIVMGSTFYEELLPYMTLGTMKRDLRAPININTADDEEIMMHLDMDDDQKRQLIIGPYRYTDPDSVAFMTQENGPYITLYTNINTATLDELLLMNDGMTYSLAKAIISYREYYPIYDYSELEVLFNDYNKSNLLIAMKDYIVFY